MLQRFELQDGGGSGNLINIWKGFKHPLTDIIPRKVLLLFDCDKQGENKNRGNLFQHIIPFQAGSPVNKEIENLFDKSILNLARQHNPGFIDIAGEHTKVARGENKVIPEEWTVNKDEKGNLCNWICENGTQDDFQHFSVIFEILEELLDPDPTPSETMSAESAETGLPPDADVSPDPSVAREGE